MTDIKEVTKIDSIKEGINRQISLRELECSLKYLLTNYYCKDCNFKFKPDDYNEFLKHIDPLMYFITSSIYPRYLNDKTVLLRCIRVYDDACFHDIRDIRSLLDLIPYANDSGELIEYLYLSYYEILLNLYNLFEENIELFFTKESKYKSKKDFLDNLIKEWKERHDKICNFYIPHQNTALGKNAFINKVSSYIKDKELGESLYHAGAVGAIQKATEDFNIGIPYQRKRVPGYITKIYEDRDK